MQDLGIECHFFWLVHGSVPVEETGNTLYLQQLHEPEVFISTIHSPKLHVASLWVNHSYWHYFFSDYFSQMAFS